jgi:hypothetical protein
VDQQQRRRLGTGAIAAPHMSVHPGKSEPLVTENGSQSTSDDSSRLWRLWLPARYGPSRPATVTVAGERIRVKRKSLELPPGPNGSRGNPYGHARWVKEWRQAAKDAATAYRMPSLNRVRISAVLYRRALGTADEDNDRARLKPLVDGLRDAGVIPKDTRDHVAWGSVTEERADGPLGYGVLLIIEEIAPADHRAAGRMGGEG